MAVTAQIKVDGSTGDKTHLTSGVAVALTNASNSGGANTWAWYLDYAPPGNAAALVNPSSATATFTPVVTGSYSLRLVVNGAVTARKIIAVRLATTGLRPIAKDEDLPTWNSDWTEDVNDAIRKVEVLTNAVAGLPVVDTTYLPAVRTQTNLSAGGEISLLLLKDVPAKTCITSMVTAIGRAYTGGTLTSGTYNNDGTLVGIATIGRALTAYREGGDLVLASSSVLGGHIGKPAGASWNLETSEAVETGSYAWRFIVPAGTITVWTLVSHSVSASWP